MPTFLSIIGTRPEAIKMAPVVRALARLPRRHRVRSVICVTAQHRQMLDTVLPQLGIRPQYDLDIMIAGQTPARVAASVLARLDPVLRSVRPDWVLVQGDTTTAAAASLAAFYAGSRIAHIEAGLRTPDARVPFPEEMNRRLACVLADLHFAPTPLARRNLLHEGTDASRIHVTGNPVIDALRWTAGRPLPRESERQLHRLGFDDRDIGPGGPSTLLVTAHRRESFGRPLSSICHALRDLSQRYGNRVRIVYPVHPNPEVRKTANRILRGLKNVRIAPPLDYASTVHILKRARLVLTDSGGLQEEAPALGVPVLVLRDVTERPEAVAAGASRVVGTRRSRIVEETVRLLEQPAAHRAMSRAMNPYGDGRAASRIVSALLGRPAKPFTPSPTPSRPPIRRAAGKLARG
jgi:UDP-N-acetylglucosamine 2-epimerase (non-hydrolysing)